MYLIDTSICIEVTKRNQEAVARFKSHLQSELKIDTVILGELLSGFFASGRSERVWRDVEQIRAWTSLLVPSDVVALQYAQIRYELQSRGEVIGVNDLWIAAHARATGLTLVTNNEDEFSRVPNLPIENWTKPA